MAQAAKFSFQIMSPALHSFKFFMSAFVVLSVPVNWGILGTFLSNNENSLFKRYGHLLRLNLAGLAVRSLSGL